MTDTRQPAASQSENFRQAPDLSVSVGEREVGSVDAVVYDLCARPSRADAGIGTRPAPLVVDQDGRRISSLAHRNWCRHGADGTEDTVRTPLGHCDAIRTAQSERAKRFGE